jgi:hypothetical protein
MLQTYLNNDQVSIRCVCGPLWPPFHRVPVLGGSAAAARLKRLKNTASNACTKAAKRPERHDRLFVIAN